MNMSSQTQRRKACDLCFTKKIKCDMLKPACSNCLLYRSECRTAMVRHRVPPVKEKIQPPKPVEDRSRVIELESRLARIEAQLQQVLEANQSRNQRQGEQPVPAMDVGGLSSRDLPDLGDADDAMDILNSLSNSDTSASDWILESHQPKLPPLEEILPAVEIFFLTFNRVIPLFHQPSFMRMLSDWYSPSSERSIPVWAAINIALALSHRCSFSAANGIEAVSNDQIVSQYMQNAQSVISELVTRDDDLLGLQVLLGIAFLFQGTKDPRPASVLIGTAIRLAHRLQLHDKESSQHHTPEIATQRSRIFWLAYHLDKDISMRTQTPSFQLDVDIDLPLPESNPADKSGVLFTKTGTASFNFFRSRVALGHIEGKVYDLLYSTRSRKVSAQERQLRVVRLESLLDDWRRSIPAEFQMEFVAHLLDPISLAYMSMLYHSYLVGMIMVHGLYSHDADWVRGMSSYSRTAIGDVGDDSDATSAKQAPPLPSGWAKCVEVSRGTMRLFKECQTSGCSVWSNACAHFSALIILLANMFVAPENVDLRLDRELAEGAMEVVDLLNTLSDDKIYHQLHGVIWELYRRAMSMTDDAAKKKDRQAEAAAEANSILTFGVQLDDDIELFQNDPIRLFDKPQQGMRYGVFGDGSTKEQRPLPR